MTENLRYGNAWRMIRTLVLITILVAGFTACQHKALPPADSLEAYVGNWKVTDAQGQVYYMILKKDGSGSTTRGDGEFGTWQLSGNQIQTQWLPKNLQIHFSTGSAKVQPVPDSKSQGSQSLTAERIDSIPEVN